MTKFSRLVFATCIAFTLHFTASAQSLSVNTDGSTAHASALLDVKSTSKGVLVPRMSKTERNAIASPATGLMVFQNAPDSVGFYYYDGTSWLWLATASSSAGWLTTGNNGTDSAINFLGTLDNKPLMFRQNNLWMGQLNTKMHNYFIGGGSGSNNTSTQNTGLGDSTLFNNTTGTGNTAIGYRSMVGSGPITGSINVAVGNNTLSSISTGSQNVAIGDNAMTSMKTGGTNIVIGPGAMEQATKGNNNIALGLWSQRGNDSASNNIGIGQSSLYYNDSSRSIGIGIEALAYSNRNNIVGIGYQAGYLNNYLQTGSTIGIENTYMGFQSGYYANTGSKNVAVGNLALFGPGYFNGDDPNNIYYKRNVAIGDSAMTAAYGSDNVAVGFKALSKSSFTGLHVAVGSRALSNTTASYPNTAVGYSSQDSLTTGAANTSLGTYSLMSNKTGGNNTAIGNAAMMEAFNPAGANYPYDNTAVGNDAMRLTRYYGQTAMGAGALRNDTGSVYNTAIGYLSMYYHLRGNSNTALGTSALRNDTTGSVNTALGVNTLYNHKSGDNNVAVGFDALLNDVDGGANTAVGTYAMVNHKTNGLNTAVGFESMYYDTAGYYNSAIGWRSYRYTKAGIENTALGVGTIEFTDSSYYNTAVGRGAMIGKGGKWNTAVGYFASGLYSGAATTNYYVNESTTIGSYAGFKNIGNQNTFVGSFSGYGGASDSLRGIENTGIGAYTLTNTTSGRSNTALGLGPLFNNITGSGNVGIGTRALANAASYNYNIAIGDSAMYGNNADENMAIGTKSMWFNNTGTQNSAVGNYALQTNSTGSYNTALGHEALLNSNANGNTAFGFLAGSGNTSGTFNTLAGYNANVGASGLTNATAIGSNAYVAQSNSMILGSISGTNGGTSDTKVGIRTTTPDSTFSVADNFLVGSSGTVQYDNSVPVMSYMFKSGSINADRMVVAHSPAFPTYGLQYQDLTDKFNFLSGGVGVLTADLGTGRVGVGTTTPAKKLHVFSGTSGAVTNAASNILMEDNANSYFEMSTPDANENGILSSNTTGIRSGIIFTNANGVQFRAGGNANRMVILSSGNVGIGTTAPTHQLQLSVDDAAKPGTNLWTVVSDERLKTINGDYSKGLKDILKLNTIRYNYKKNDAIDLPTNEQFYGFSAQDVQKVFPEAVKVMQNGYLSLNIHPIVIAYVNAFKEQQQQIDELKKQNDLLIKRIEKLENK